ncbi:MAG: ParB N-terminal domain-containing protein [Candidatus Kapabacteria bacterium]|nr:ParB N-terminal domain-containing protein [Candidatus Kapabacteria bacterium]
MIKKGKKEIEKKNVSLKELAIEYVSVDSIKPNNYNPNRQSEHDFELLLKSMEEDGFTQPIIVQQSTKMIVDGEHRWRAATVLGYTEIPVVFVEMTPEQMRIATLRHNRARGSEDLELSVQVLRDLQELGALDWAQDSLMLSDDEINRLLDDIPVPEALANDDYSQSWEPSELSDEDNQITDTSSRQVDGTTHGGEMITAASSKAVETIKERQALIQVAKNEEEREMARQQTKLYRVSLIFANEEAEIIEKVLGKEPALKLLELCKKEFNNE